MAQKDLLPKIRQFKEANTPEGARDLSRQLSRFEDNVGDITARLDQAKMERLTPKSLEVASGIPTVGPGQSLGIVDAVTDVQLDKFTASDAGKFLAICKAAGVGATNVHPPNGAKLNGATTAYAMGAGGMLLVYCDGVAYWAVS